MDKEVSDHTDQAEQLKNIFNEVEQNQAYQELDQEKHTNPSNHVQRIDVLNLPPRKEVHSKHNNRTRLKFGRPLLRLLIVIMIFIAVVSGAYFLWGEELILIIKNV